MIVFQHWARIKEDCDCWGKGNKWDKTYHCKGFLPVGSSKTCWRRGNYMKYGNLTILRR